MPEDNDTIKMGESRSLDEKLEVRCSKPLKQKVRVTAAEAGMDMAPWIREQLRGATGDE